MHKIKVFLTLLIVHCSLLIGTASAQWWVQGGNLLWPYGDVTINKNLFLNGLIKLDRPSELGFTEFLTWIDDSSSVASNHIANDFTNQIVIDNYTAKNTIQNGLITATANTWINQTGGHFDDNFSANAFTATCYVLKTTNDTIPNVFINRARVFTGSSGNHVKNLYSYFSRADAWVKLNIENAYSFYSDGTSFGTYATVSNMHHFYGAGDYPSYFGGVIKAKQFQLNTLNTAPANASDTGTAGEIRVDANYIYVCVATNTWKRVAIATW